MKLTIHWKYLTTSVTSDMSKGVCDCRLCDHFSKEDLVCKAGPEANRIVLTQCATKYWCSSYSINKEKRKQLI